MAKAKNPDFKCGVYRNSAHMWSNYATVRKALQDRRYWGFFLPWANTTARNYSTGGAGENLYYDTTQTPHLAVSPWNGTAAPGAPVLTVALLLLMLMLLPREVPVHRRECPVRRGGVHGGATLRLRRGRAVRPVHV